MTGNCYWYKTCPTCGEGRLFIVEDLSRQRLYLHCEEDELGFEDPLDLKSPDKVFLTLDFDYPCRFADWETISAQGWEEFATHSVDLAQAPKLC